MLKHNLRWLAGQLGIAFSTVYSWRKWGVPQYAKAYVQLALNHRDLQIRTGCEK